MRGCGRWSILSDRSGVSASQAVADETDAVGVVKEAVEGGAGIVGSSIKACRSTASSLLQHDHALVDVRHGFFETRNTDDNAFRSSFSALGSHLFSNVKTWLNGTFHGVSAKHLPRYALCARVEPPLQSPPAHRRSDRFLAPPSRHPVNHHLPPTRRRRSNQRSPTCSNRIGKRGIQAEFIEVVLCRKGAIPSL